MLQVASIPLPVPSREWLNKHMGAKGFSEGLTAWLGSNLVARKESGGLTWAFDIEGGRTTAADHTSETDRSFSILIPCCRP